MLPSLCVCVVRVSVCVRVWDSSLGLRLRELWGVGLIVGASVQDRTPLCFCESYAILKWDQVWHFWRSTEFWEFWKSVDWSCLEEVAALPSRLQYRRLPGRLRRPTFNITKQTKIKLVPHRGRIGGLVPRSKLSSNVQDHRLVPKFQQCSRPRVCPKISAISTFVA